MRPGAGARLAACNAGATVGARALPRARLQAPSRRRRVCATAVLHNSIEDPYRTLGVSANASEGEIKRAYRQLALKYHPDVAGQSHDAERRFVSIQQAYEVLTGKRRAPVSGAHTQNQHGGWEFQDWFWSFSASRRWSAQHHARPQQDGARAPQERTVLNSQLAGLRQRAAIRHTKKARDAAAPAAAAAAAGDASSPQQQEQQPAEQREQQQHHHQQQQPDQDPASHHHDYYQQQQHHHYQHRPAVEYDSTAMSDGVNMANGHGYDPWSPEAAAAAPRPRFTATESAKTRVSGQLGGLRRRAAVKARADAEQARPSGGREEPAAAAAAGGGGFTAVEDDPWGV
ncbi:hypothetical protein Rsub_03221 [Raphidocelis subcapitata]|uniref:J domain-containing protein n=1 Tax=Raphidocelis subcapitata TaxID=307507 RepID=A0A2V0NTL0_9CHLO|nr:hypothetical protein Rsub_03221 [Raphidocelis subcapitata]|eukprot:GBF90649.1 hypothetical protein Rsub_03221 [Raphidocelis subcapitata]